LSREPHVYERPKSDPPVDPLDPLPYELPLPALLPVLPPP
jgi:hypothetical protein